LFVRMLTVNLKPNTATEFPRTFEKEILPMLRKQKGFKDELTLVGAGGKEAVGLSFWDQKESADVYERTVYPEVISKLAKVVEGSPRLQTYDVGNSIAHNIAVSA
jgi:heme-degrading monooxygenase HmoA